MGVGDFARGIVPAAKQAPEMAGGALRVLVTVAIDGVNGLPGAKMVAARQLQKTGDVEDAIEALVGQHTTYASAQGFVANVGGLIASVVAMPGNLTGLALVQVRMVASIAHLRGYDIDDPRVRTAILMCLLGGDQINRQIDAGKLPSTPLAVATAPVFDPGLDKLVADRVLRELAARVGGRNGALLFTKRIPLLGGGVGAVTDGYITRQIGFFTRGELVRRRALR